MYTCYLVDSFWISACNIEFFWSIELGISSSFRSDQIRSVAQSCPTLCDPMNRSTPGLPDHHQLLELAQTHVHRVSDAIQPSHSLLPPSPPDSNFSQHQGSFKMSQFFSSGGQNIAVSALESVLWMNVQDRFPLGWTDWISLQSKELSRVSINSSVLSFLDSPILTSTHDYWENHSLD